MKVDSPRNMRITAQPTWIVARIISLAHIGHLQAVRPKGLSAASISPGFSAVALLTGLPLCHVPIEAIQPRREVLLHL